jgi:plastocyanin
VGLAACDGSGSGLIGNAGGGPGGGSNTNPLVAAVAVTNFAFAPNAASIRPGGSVTWTWNSDTTSHNVTFANSTRNSGTRRIGPHVVQFPQSGSFPYSCTIHSGMTGVVTVN